MNTKDRFEDIVRKDLEVRADDGTYDRMRRIVLAAYGSTERTKIPTFARRLVMDRRVVKFALAAVVVAAVVLGLFEFLSPVGSSGVVWAEVAKKVEASRGVVFRVRTTGSEDPNKDWPNQYVMTRRSPKYSRTDRLRDGRPSRMVSFNLDTKTVLWLDHDRKAYFKKPMNKEDSQSLQSEWSDPKALLDLFMSRGYRQLGRKTINGMVCEGIETTDPVAAKVNFPVKSLSARLWASVETGYPVLAEIEVVRADNSQRQTSTADQFQWGVEIGLSEIDVAVPPDYQLID